MNKNIEINGVIFETLDKPTKRVVDMVANASIYWESYGNQPRTIREAYGRFSDTKERIYETWQDFYKGMPKSDNMEFRIASHNSQFFTIAIFWGNRLLYITPSHNYCIVLTRDIVTKVRGWESSKPLVDGTKEKKTDEKVTAKELLVYLSIIYDNNWERIYEHISSRHPLDKEDLRRTLKGVSLDDYVALTDIDYPEEFKVLARPPFTVLREDVDELIGIMKVSGKEGR